MGVVAGVLCLLMALGAYVSDHALDKSAVQADAQVEGVTGAKDPQYRVRFSLPDGRVVTTRTDFANADHRVGDTIRVEYDPSDPKTVAEVGSRSGAWILYDAFGLMGVAAVGYSVFRLWRPKKSDG